MAKDLFNKTARARTDDLRREIDRAASGWRHRLRSRNFILAAMIWFGFIVVVGGVVLWAREAPKVAEGRVMNSTRIARVTCSVVNEARTRAAREEASRTTPRVCVLDSRALDEIRASLESLPIVVQGAETPDQLDPDLSTRLGITPEALRDLRGEMIDGRVSRAWVERVDRLCVELLRAPILTEEDFKEVSARSSEIDLRQGGPAPRDAGGETREAPAMAPHLRVSIASVIRIGSERLPFELRSIVAAAGFTGPVAEVVTRRLATPPVPTYAFDSEASAQARTDAAAAVPVQVDPIDVGDVIYKRGEPLTSEQIDRARAVAEAERRSMAWWQVWAGRLALLGLVVAIAGALAGYTALFVPKVRRNPARSLGVAGLLAAVTIVGCWSTVATPGLIALTGVAPTVFATVILAVAYHQRVALAYGSLHGVLMCVALDQPIGMYAVMVTGIGAAVWQLKEIRDRDALIRMGVVEAVALAAGTLMVNLIELPPTPPALKQMLWDAGLAGGGGFLVSALALYLLPTFERTFGLVTGMTLIELRDPKQPLLRQLQQRAPGTYNHSLTIASLGEAAAEAIGADGLLTYVGALYHDIGKMNKPDYFVENQTPGINRHDRLSPAMSVLVIVGHVKDGMELAREFNLPKPVHHFIESHHGTTLVEYFYHRARKQAEAAAERDDGEEAELPAEIEYRYPGPKPRTKEAAIIMLCDTVESASRTMADPTPARIDQLVRGIANKRLMDGQFDECDLTLRELNLIVETVSKTLASIYHGRIQYPSGASAGAAPAHGEPPTATVPSPAPAPRERFAAGSR